MDLKLDRTNGFRTSEIRILPDLDQGKQITNLRLTLDIRNNSGYDLILGDPTSLVETFTMAVVEPEPTRSGTPNRREVYVYSPFPAFLLSALYQDMGVDHPVKIEKVNRIPEDKALAQFCEVKLTEPQETVWSHILAVPANQEIRVEIDLTAGTTFFSRPCRSELTCHLSLNRIFELKEIFLRRATLTVQTDDRSDLDLDRSDLDPDQAEKETYLTFDLFDRWISDEEELVEQELSFGTYEALILIYYYTIMREKDLISEDLVIFFSDTDQIDLKSLLIGDNVCYYFRDSPYTTSIADDFIRVNVYRRSYDPETGRQTGRQTGLFEDVTFIEQPSPEAYLIEESSDELLTSEDILNLQKESPSFFIDPDDYQETFDLDDLLDPSLPAFTFIKEVTSTAPEVKADLEAKAETSLSFCSIQ